jgi:hypothetical protein
MGVIGDPSMTAPAAASSPPGSDLSHERERLLCFITEAIAERDCFPTTSKKAWRTEDVRYMSHLLQKLRQENPGVSFPQAFMNDLALAAEVAVSQHIP